MLRIGCWLCLESGVGNDSSRSNGFALRRWYLCRAIRSRSLLGWLSQCTQHEIDRIRTSRKQRAAMAAAASADQLLQFCSVGRRLQRIISRCQVEQICTASFANNRGGPPAEGVHTSRARHDMRVGWSIPCGQLVSMLDVRRTEFARRRGVCRPDLCGASDVCGGGPSTTGLNAGPCEWHRPGE